MYQIFSKIWIPLLVLLFIPLFVEGEINSSIIFEEPLRPDPIDISPISIFLIFLAVFLAVFFWTALPFYVYFAICLIFLGRKTQTPRRWMAWVPILNIYLLCKIAGKSGWWLVVFLLPIIFIIFGLILIPFFPDLPHSAGFIIYFLILLLMPIFYLAILVIWVILWWKIAGKVERPGWWGILMLIPIVGLPMIGVLSFTSKEKFNNKKAHILFLIIFTIVVVAALVAWLQ